MDRPNLTVLTQALVTKLTLEGKRATGVEIAFDGKIQRITSRLEVVLSLGAMHTPKVLMLSGIGDEAELRRLGVRCGGLERRIGQGALGFSMPMGRLGQPEDIARVALFLASDQSAWVTGERISVSGGQR